MSRKTKITIAILLGIAALAYCEQVPSVLINQISDAFGLEGASVGLSNTALSGGCMIAMFVVPLLQGRITKFNTIRIALLVIGAALIAASFMPVYAAFFAMILIMGLGAGSLDTLCNSSMVDIHPTDNAKYLGALHGLFGVGSLTAPLLIQGLIDRNVNWTVIFIIVGCIFGAVFAVFSILTASAKQEGISKAEPVSEKEQKITVTDIREFFSEKRNLLITLAAVMYSFFQSTMLVWIVRYTTIRFDNAKAGSICLSVFWIFATISRFLGPHIRMDKLKLYIAGILTGGAALLAGILIGRPEVMIAVYGVIGLVSGFSMPVLISAITDGQGSRTSLAASSIMLLMSIPRMLTPVILGALAAGISQDCALSLGVVVSVLGAIAAFSAGKVSAHAS